MSSPTIPAPNDGTAAGTSRRRFLTYLVAAPTLAVAVQYGLLDGVAQALPGTPELGDVLDLGDVLILSGAATSGLLIVLVAEEDGTVSCALPREEVGQGITTAVAMLLADELGLPLSKVTVTVADARPELLFGQFTGGSNSIRSIYDPILAAAALFRGRMAAAGAAALAVSPSSVVLRDGSVVAQDGRTVGFGDLAAPAAATDLKAPADAPATSTAGSVVGTPQNRIDALGMVTGAFRYTNDIPDAEIAGGRQVYRSMVRRAPFIRGSVKSIDNLDAVKSMPGVKHVSVVELSRIAFLELEVIETGVAVVAETFGQALDAKEALQVTWNRGPLADEDDASIKKKLRGVAIPVTPALPDLLTKTVTGEFDVAFASHAPLESNTAIADVRDGRATVWAGLKTPNVAEATIAEEIGLPVTVKVVQGGGSFGRRLFFDAALEAARISKAAGVPVKHMWTRIDDMRHGRARAASHHRVQIVHAGGDVLSLEHRVASVETDFRHGLSDIITGVASQVNLPSALLPISAGGNATFAQVVFLTTVKSPYSTGVTTQLLNELNLPFNTGSFRSVYSASARGIEEVMIDRLAASMREDPAKLRLRLLSDERAKAVLQKVMDMGSWGKAMPAGTAQGIAFHEEYRSMTACLVEIDVRGPLAGNPRITKAFIAADYGLPINPRGLEAQLQGGLNDAISTVLRAGLHLDDGLFLEGSYSQFHFSRQAQSPTEMKVFIFPETTGRPGGAGELGLPGAVGAVANAYARATGKTVTSFPIIFPVDFVPFTKGTGSTRQPSNLPPAQA